MTDDRIALLDLDDAPRGTAAAGLAPAPELDLIADPADPVCVSCGERGAVDDRGECRACWENRLDGSQSSGVQADFGAIAAESSANAAGESMAELGANGLGNFGVGFSTDEGYITALRRGATQRSLDEYTALLRQRGYKVDVLQNDWAGGPGRYRVAIEKGDRNYAFQAQLIPSSGYDDAGPAEVDSHANDEAIALLKQQSAARKAAAAKVKAELDAQTVLATAPVETHEHVVLRHGALIAGAAADGHGILIGWDGKGPLSHARLTELAIAAGITEKWRPEPKEVSTQARRAVQRFASSQLTFYTEDRGRKWRLEEPSANAKPGETSGHVKLVATLVGEATLECEGDSTLSVQVQAEFQRLVDEQLHDAGDITGWMVKALKGMMSAVAYGGNWYVPRQYRPIAEALTSTLIAAKWGEGWMDPPLPIATSAQLAQGLANGLRVEIDAVIADADKGSCRGRGQRQGARQGRGDQLHDQAPQGQRARRRLRAASRRAPRRRLSAT